VTLEPDDKKALSDIRMAKAREFLSDAEANLKDHRLKTAVNRSYYAALNAVRSPLIMDGANPLSHDGVLTVLSLKFVKTGRLSVEVVKQFKTLLSRRTDVDYGDFDAIGTDDAADSVKLAAGIIERIDAVRGTFYQ